MTHRDRAIPIFVVIAATALAAYGCAPDAESSTTDATSTESTDATTVDEGSGLSGPECLVGDWVIAQDQMQVFYDALGAANDNLEITIDGYTGLSFTETSFSYTPEFTLLLAVAGADGTGTITGSIGGDYAADEETITTSQETNDTALSVTVGGVTMDGSDLFASILSGSPINSAPYECAADGPLIQFDTGTGRVPVQLTAR